MAENLAVWVVLGLALVAANLPFLFERVLFVRRPAAGRKTFGWRLLELTLLYIATGFFAAMLERGAYGSVYPQGWAFYVTTSCLFLVFAFPGFVYRYLWRVRRRGAEKGADLEKSAD
ncbi:MAG: DUF2818 family protein [Azoarcus sp.]|jgi:hypothetical protein|nr:DUF2818 family protein [Azoarcus sp.]